MQKHPLSIALVLSAVALSAGVGVRIGMFAPITAQLQGGSYPPSGSELPSCGNGTCDAGETIPPYGGSICFSDCRCGDGRCDAHEKSGSGMFCPMDCGDECGDGMFGATETCDDGNRVDGDGCNKDCGYECGDGVRDTNAADGYSELCDGEFGCVNDCQFMEGPGISDETSTGSTVCKPYDPAFNDVDADRVNVVFVGAGISGTGELVNGIRISSEHIASLEPFASAKDKLQFWYVDEIRPLGPGTDDYTKSCLESCASNVSCPELRKQYVNILCNRECLSHADFDGVAHVSYPNLVENPGTFSHEFGHQFGELPDEYVMEGVTADWTKRPSCAPSLEKAREWWGSLAGKEDPLLGTVGYHRGCSYDDTNYRPDLGPGNVMWVGAPWYGYGELIHQPYIKRKLDTYSGYSPRAAKQTAGFWRRLFAQVLPPPSVPAETAMRLTLRRQDDGAYDILSAEVTAVPYGVKPTMQSGMSVTVMLGDASYTQTFSPNRVSIAEEFSDPNEIHFGSFEEIPLETVSVDVGLGDTPQDVDMAGLRTVIVPCDDNDESGDNDCPAPMYRGEPIEMSALDAASSVSSRSVPFSSDAASSVVMPAFSSSNPAFVSSAASSQSSAALMVHAAASDDGMGWQMVLATVLIGLSLGALADYAWSKRKGNG